MNVNAASLCHVSFCRNCSRRCLTAVKQVLSVSQFVTVMMHRELFGPLLKKMKGRLLGIPHCFCSIAPPLPLTSDRALEKASWICWWCWGVHYCFSLSPSMGMFMNIYLHRTASRNIFSLKWAVIKSRPGQIWVKPEYRALIDNLLLDSMIFSKVIMECITSEGKRNLKPSNCKGKLWYFSW